MQSPVKMSLSTLAALDGYDWTKPGSAPRLEDVQTKAIETLAQTGLGELGVQDIARLYKAGAYAIHVEKKSEVAEALLQKAYDALQANTEARDEFRQNGDYFRVTNNLAFALTNQRDTGEVKLSAAQAYLNETLEGSRDPILLSFAKRIEGQGDFARAARAKRFDHKLELVQWGVDKCKEGADYLPKPEEVSDAARTYNRNAVELYKLLESAPRRMQQAILSQAWEQSRTAAALWLEHTAAGEFDIFKRRTEETVTDLRRFAAENGFTLPTLLLSEKIAGQKEARESAARR